GARQESDAAPVAFVGLRMRNKAEEHVGLVVGWQVVDPLSGQEIQSFRVSREFLDTHGGGDDRVRSHFFLPARQEKEFVLPLFADTHQVLPGRYFGRITVSLFGSDAVVLQQDLPFTVRKISWASLGLTLYAVLVTLAVSTFLLLRNKRIFQRFKTKWLILIALFGAAKFLVSLVPRFFLNELFNGLLGPFAVFVNGIFREGITNLFVMALVVLIPLPGVVTLSTMMSLVLFCLLGNFNPVIILFMMVSMSTMEIALYCTGFTRNTSQEFSRSRKALIGASLGMGLAGAFAVFVDYNLYMLLYRLYYASWYVWANILLVGFLYTAISAPCGVMLGNKLKQTALQ
ncbi:MAG: hypothetical protein D3910_11150, partial [Candidatus Electrothrix sp. ATG2]|nr:hypothetical protein [Candidatus Electrothrix sp. ATG2]